MSGRYRDFPCIPRLHTCIASIIINIFHQSGTFVTTNEPILTHHYHPKSRVYITVHYGVVHSMSLEKFKMTCIYQLSIIQNSFTALKILCGLPIHSSTTLLPQPPSLPHPLTIIDLFTVFTVLPFPEWHIVEIIKYAAFSDQLLTISSMYLGSSMFFMAW